MLLTLEVAAQALFEAHRDALNANNPLEWKDMQVDIRNRYRKTASLFLLNLDIPYEDMIHVDNP